MLNVFNKKQQEHTKKEEILASLSGKRQICFQQTFYFKYLYWNLQDSFFIILLSLNLYY